MEIRTQVSSLYALIHQKLNPYKIENLSSSKTEKKNYIENHAHVLDILLKCRDHCQIL